MVDKHTSLAGSNLPEIFESIDDAIAFLTRVESPLLAALGFPNGLQNVLNVKHEWLEEQLNPDAAIINNGGGHLAGDTALNVVAGQGSRFLVGDIVQIDGSRELMTVTAPIAANVVTVVRATFGSGPAVPIANGAVLKRISNPAVENESAPAANPTNRIRKDNYTQIFRKVAAVTRSMMLSNVIGVEDELDRQLLNAQRDLIRDLAKATINGRRQTVNPEGTLAVARTMDGLIPQILNGADPVIVDATGNTLDEFLLNQALREQFTRGASPRILAAPPAQRRAISALIEGRQRFESNEGQLGAVVTRFLSDFAVLDVIEADIFIPSDSVLLIDPSKISLKKLGNQAAPWEIVDIGRPGLSTVREVVGEFTLEAKNAGDGGHALIQGLAV